MSLTGSDGRDSSAANAGSSCGRGSCADVGDGDTSDRVVADEGTRTELLRNILPALTNASAHLVHLCQHTDIPFFHSSPLSPTPLTVSEQQQPPMSIPAVALTTVDALCQVLCTHVRSTLTQEYKAETAALSASMSIIHYHTCSAIANLALMDTARASLAFHNACFLIVSILHCQVFLDIDMSSSDPNPDLLLATDTDSTAGRDPGYLHSDSFDLDKQKLQKQKLQKQKQQQQQQKQQNSELRDVYRTNRVMTVEQSCMAVANLTAQSPQNAMIFCELGSPQLHTFPNFLSASYSAYISTLPSTLAIA